jgi:signal transduction histidine kinase/ligand-binding sensor domain-containing protein
MQLMRPAVSLLLAATVALVDARLAGAQSQPRLLSGYTLSSWTLAEGVPIGPINAIGQDADGYLWLGTIRGVVRFDGARFTPWNSISPVSLPEAEVLALSASRDGTLWVGFARVEGRVSVAALRNGKVVTVSEGTAPRDSTIAVLADRAGDVWAVSEGRLHRLRDGRWTVVQPQPLGDAAVLSVGEDLRGTLWVGTREGLFRRRDDDRFELIDQGIARDASEGADGALWITDPAHGARRHGAPPRLTSANGRGMRLLHDARRNLWVATTGQGVWRVRDDAPTVPPLVERLTTQTGLSSDVVQSMLEDREGNIWVGTMLGLHSLAPQQLTPLAVDALVQAILPDPDGSMWVTTASGILQFHDDGGSWRSRRVSDRPDVQSLFRDARGRAWARTSQGVRAFVRGRIGDLAPAGGVAPPCSHGATMSPTDGRGRAPDRRPRMTVTAAAEPPVALRPVCVTRDAVWAAGTGDTLTVRRDDRVFVRIRLPSPPAVVSQRAIDTIFEDAQGTMWAGSTAGLWRIHGGTAEHFGEHEGLPAQRVMAMTQSADGALWLAVDRGRLHPGRRAALIRLHPPALGRRRATTPLTGYDIYDAVDGLAGVAVGTATAARAADGTLWFAIGGSLTVVDPRYVAAKQRPDLLAQIATARVDDRLVTPGSTGALPAGTREVQIDYTALRLTAPGQIRFRYRLDGFDRDWVDAGARRQAYYTNLDPGRYVFRVQATGDATGWIAPETQWAFAVQPAFHQTGWFYALVGTALLLMAWGVAQTRVWILNRQFAATLAERTRLSRELHDTMLQSLAGIALQVQAIARQCLPGASEQRSQLLALRREVEEYIREARQAILNLRSPLLDAGGLAGALTEIGRRAVVPPTRFELSADRIAAEAETEGELLRIGQEAITNAARHATATRIRVDVHQDADRIRLRVTDDGRGFDVGAATASHSEHHGLLGMQERAARLGGRLSITSSTGGTVVEASVPYARRRA